MSIMKKFLISWGIATLIGNSILIYYTFINAFFHNYRTVVLVNVFNEAWFEFFFIPISIIVGVWTLKQFASGKIIIVRRGKNESSV